MDEVRRGRVLGTLRPGDALPSVRQLAADLGVNPNTVRQAYGELAKRALRDAERHGAAPDELIESIRQAAGSPARSSQNDATPRQPSE